MPIDKLFVEGTLESEVLNPIFQGSPVLQRGGSKNSLRPRARTERQENKVSAGYLRDRDFDFEPPADLSRPTVDCEDNNVPIGWRWCRHETENYLIEPALIEVAMNWHLDDIEEAIRNSAMRIRNYEAARWTIGTVRRVLPPHYELNTRPNNLNEIALPTDLEQSSVRSWAIDSISAHGQRIIAAVDQAHVQESFSSFAAKFDKLFINDVGSVLLWFSGKDILAGMADWLHVKDIPNPGAFRARMRDWIIANPETTLEILPEWDRLTEVLRS